MLNCSQGLVCEPRKKLSRPEKHLYKIWLDKNFQLEHLKTNSGKSLSIINTGHRNESEGPDFLNAMVLLDDTLLTGDIEIHIENKDWYSHGHDQDENYNDVVLHVIESNTEEQTIRLENGKETEILVLNFNKKQADPITPPCTEWKNLDFDIFCEIIEEYGSKRYQRKTLQARKLLLQHQPEHYFFIGLLDVMGYSQNRHAMKTIAKQISFDKLYRIMEPLPEAGRLVTIEPLLLGISGLLNVDFQKYYNNDAYFFGLKQKWETLKTKYQLSAINNPDFHFAGTRPVNYPHKRLVALAQILVNIFPQKPGQYCLNTLFSGRNTEKILDMLREKFQMPAGMWKNHPLFSSHHSNVLIGNSRLMDFITNIMLPFARALSSILKNEQNANYCILINKQIPRGAMPGKIKKLLHRLNIPESKIKTNYLLQGSIEYHRLFCDLELCDMCLLENTIEH